MRKVISIISTLAMFSLAFGFTLVNQTDAESDFIVGYEEASTIPEYRQQVEVESDEPMVSIDFEKLTTEPAGKDKDKTSETAETTEETTKKQAETTTEIKLAEEPTRSEEPTVAYTEPTVPAEEPANPVQTTKQETTAKPTEKVTTKIIDNNVPAQSQQIADFGQNNVNTITNSIKTSCTGTYDNNMQNLAVYMANNGKSNAQSTLNALCPNNDMTVVAETTSVTIPSKSSDDVINAALTISNRLMSSFNKYGIGIKVESVRNGYKITAVVCAKTN